MDGLVMVVIAGGVGKCGLGRVRGGLLVVMVVIASVGMGWMDGLG